LDPEELQISTVTSLLKSYLRELPNDLLPISRHGMLAYRQSTSILNALKNTGTLSAPATPLVDQTPTLASSINVADVDVQFDYQVLPVQLLQEELQQLSYYEFSLLHVITLHLKMVVDHSNVNKMTLSNLAVIFSPTLEINSTVLMALISRCDILWSGLTPQVAPPNLCSVKGSKVEPVDDEDYLTENEPLSPLTDYYRPGFFRRVDQDSGPLSPCSRRPSGGSLFSSEVLHSGRKPSMSSLVSSEVLYGNSTVRKPSVTSLLPNDVLYNGNTARKPSAGSLFSSDVFKAGNAAMVDSSARKPSLGSLFSSEVLKSGSASIAARKPSVASLLSNEVMNANATLSLGSSSPSKSLKNGSNQYSLKRAKSANLIGIGIGFDSAPDSPADTVASRRRSKVPQNLTIDVTKTQRYPKGLELNSAGQPSPRVFLHHSGSQSGLKSPMVELVNH
jgi:hypothetical protein